MPSDTTATVTVKVETMDVSTQVVRVDVEDVDRGADKATFVLDDPGSTTSDVLRPGAIVRIELGWETEYALAFVGKVTATHSLAGAGPQGRIEVTCKDQSILFDTRPPLGERKYTGTVSDIVKRVAARVKMPIGKIDVSTDKTWTETEPCLQKDRTDWEFLQDLAELLRARAFVEVNADPKDPKPVKLAGGEPKLYFMSEDALIAQEPMGTLLYCRGMGKLLQFEYKSIGAGAAPAASATVANPDTGKSETRDTPPAAAEPQPAPSAGRTDQVTDVLGAPRADDHAQGMQVASEAATQPDAVRAKKEPTGAPSDPAALERRIKQDKTRVLGYFGKGTAIGTVFLRAKGPVKIDGLASWASGRWYVRRVNHVFERTALDKKVSVSFRSSFEATR
jgi:phage protein D